MLRIFEEFRVSTPQITGLYPSRWDDLTEEVAAACATLLNVLVQTRCSTTIYQQFAHFLLEEYKIPSGILTLRCAAIDGRCDRCY